ncbi:MAG TPA: calcium/sodium antiporter [Caldithrix sp.]|nr:calcium/sodium antiporter [Caldithrix sp.]
MLLQFFILIIGLGLLWFGAELLIRYSSKLARSLGVSPIIVGLTVISIGTSLPEFVVSLIAAMQNTMGISIGNIIGSNIANIGLILGIGAIMTTLKVQKSWVHREVPIMIAATLLFSLFSWNGAKIGRLEGFILFVLLLLFLYYLSRTSANQMREFKAEQLLPGSIHIPLTTGKKILYLLYSLIGIALLIGGSKLTVTSGAKIAEALGVSDTVVGLTLIALGTSLPELATTIVGILHKETDLVVGNVIGSNIFNLLFIGGVVPMIRPIPIATNLFFVEFPFLIGLSFLIWIFMRNRWNVTRWEGVVLLLLYCVFIVLTFGL